MSKRIYFIIILGFIINIFISFFYIEKFNSYELLDTDDELRHSLIKGINENHWNKAYKLKKDLESGKNFFQSGSAYDRNYLPSLNFFLYSKISSDQLYENYDNELKISQTDKKIYFLIFQSLFYCISIFFLLKILSIYIDKKLIVIFAIIFSLEPSLNQWHSSFFSASIFTSLQIFLLAFLFKLKKNYFDYFVIGFILALLFAQRSAAVFYIFILLFIFAIFIKKYKIRKILIFILSYLIFISFIAYHNYNRSGLIYFTPLDQRTALYNYCEPAILNIKNKSQSFEYEKKKILEKLNEWKNNKNLDLKNEQDLLFYYDEMKRNSINSILKHPIISIKYAIKKSVHSGLLNPVYIFFFHKTEYEGKNPYYGSETHKKIIKYRLYYSAIFYLVSIYGFYHSFKYFRKDFIFLNSLSYCYFLLILGWMGSTRYYTSCLPFLFIFFGIGIYQIFAQRRKVNK